MSDVSTRQCHSNGRLAKPSVKSVQGLLFISGALLLTWIIFNPGMLSNRTLNKVWDEITYLFPNFNGYTTEVWEQVIDLIPHLMMM